MIEHITSEQIDDFRRGRLSDPERRNVAGHLASCAACRSHAAADRSIALAAAGLADDFTAGEHPEIDELFDYGDGRLDAARAAAVATHLRECTRCAEDVADASREREALQPRLSLAWLPLAASLLIAVVVAWWFVRSDSRPGPVVQRLPPQPATAEIAMPSVLADLRPAQESLRGAASPGVAIDMHPSGVVVTSDTPEFSWRAARDRTSIVTVMCNDTIAAVSDRIRGGRWRPRRPLPRGVRCVWQIELLPEHTIEPQPPDPQPAFRVLDAATLASIEKNGRDDFTSGVLYARAGAQQEAMEHLGHWLQAHPNDARARSVLDSVRRW